EHDSAAYEQGIDSLPLANLDHLAHRLPDKRRNWDAFARDDCNCRQRRAPRRWQRTLFRRFRLDRSEIRDIGRNYWRGLLALGTQITRRDWNVLWHAQVGKHLLSHTLEHRSGDGAALMQPDRRIELHQNRHCRIADGRKADKRSNQLRLRIAASAGIKF